MAADIDELFEAGSPLARRLAAEGPFADAAAIAVRARQIAAGLSEDEMRATLAAHPAIGADPGRMSALSRAEQGDDSAPELAELNAQYEARHGFRFVTFVNGRSKREVAEELRRRLPRPTPDEMNRGLQAVLDIAADRAAKVRR